MHYVHYEDVAAILSEEQFLDLVAQFSGYAIPGSKTEHARQREEFYKDPSYDGNVAAAATKYGVCQRTIRNWIRKRPNSSKTIPQKLST